MVHYNIVLCFLSFAGMRCRKGGITGRKLINSAVLQISRKLSIRGRTNVELPFDSFKFRGRLQYRESCRNAADRNAALPLDSFNFSGRDLNPDRIPETKFFPLGLSAMSYESQVSIASCPPSFRTVTKKLPFFA